MESVQSDCETTSKKRTDSSSVITQWKSTKKVEIANTQNDYETTSKKWTDKKKTNLFCEFCKSVSIPREQVQDFLEN